VLGALILDNRVAESINEKLTAEDFYRQDHQLIYEAIMQLAHARKPCDFVTLCQAMRESGQLEEAGGLAYLGNLANETPSAANVEAYAEIVRERAVLRRLIAVGGDIAESGFRPGGQSHEELIDQAEAKISVLREKRSPQAARTVASYMTEVENKIGAARDRGGGLQGMSMGYADLDKKLDGMHAGDLILVAGRPSMGKTAFAMSVAEYVAMYEKKGVAVFSMEMPGDQITMRTVSSFTRIDMQKLRSGELEDRDWDRLVAQGSLIREAPIYIDDTGTLSPTGLRARARKLKREHDIQLIIVDYVQLMHGDGKHENRTNELAEVSRGLKRLAKELRLPVLALCQLNRGVEARVNKRPMMADLRECGQLEQDADVIAFIYRDEVYNPESNWAGSAEIIIAKQRNGPIGMVRLAYLPQFVRFENLAQGYYEEHRSKKATSKKKSALDKVMAGEGPAPSPLFNQE
jgi:replicative DNA helicase